MQSPASYEAPALCAIPVLHAPGVLVAAKVFPKVGNFMAPVDLLNHARLVPKGAKSLPGGSFEAARQAFPPKLKTTPDGDYEKFSLTWKLNVVQVIPLPEGKEEKQDAKERKKTPDTRVTYARYVTPWAQLVKLQLKDPNGKIKTYNDQLVIGKTSRFGEGAHTSPAYGTPQDIAANGQHMLDMVDDMATEEAFKRAAVFQLDLDASTTFELKDYGNNLPSIMEAGDQLDGSSRSYVSLPEFEGKTSYQVRMVTNPQVTMENTRLRPANVDETRFFDNLRRQAAQADSKANGEMYAVAMDGRWHLEYFISGRRSAAEGLEIKSMGKKFVFTPTWVYICPVRAYENNAGYNKAFTLINKVFPNKIFTDYSVGWYERWSAYVASLRPKRTKRKSTGGTRARKRVRQEEVRQEDIPASQKGSLADDMDEDEADDDQDISNGLL